MDNVCFTLDGAARTVVLGPNGAGKSILLRLCNGLLQPTSGTIAWNGFCAADASRRQSMVFQRPVLLRRSAAANIAHALKISGIARAHRAELVEKALSMAGLEKSGRQSARSLSGGEQQRLSIARAAVLEPDVLLLDEPTSNLDPGATRVVEELIHDIDRDSVFRLQMGCQIARPTPAKTAAMKTIVKCLHFAVAHRRRD